MQTYGSGNLKRSREVASLSQQYVKIFMPAVSWIFEVGGFLTGVISEVELGAQSIAYQLCVVAYMCPLGFSVAATIRVGNAIGAGNIKQTRLSCKVSIICAFIVVCFVGVCINITRKVIGFIFTSYQMLLQEFLEELENNWLVPFLV
ncbi:hypothetical protein ILYODFUR_021197 [Ilyodon furcidens]|uniref:Uncharacterized protein n=1 Tax=Ilyodon furcidens TaxID=33524 RepID=A0ABV0VFS5_9TELE